jgi:tetratricopeptide (TPR) repeat protein
VLALCALIGGCASIFGRGDSPRHAEAEARLEEGRSLARDGRLAEAAEAFEDATYADPQSAEAHYLHARALLELGRTYPALDALRRAEALRDDHPQQRVLMGRILIRLGRLDEAEPVLMSAVESWPEEPRCHFAIGALRLRQGRLEEAEVSLTTARRADPRIPGLQEMLGRALLRLGRTDQALQRFEEALAQRECDDLARGGYAATLMLLRQPGRAEAELQRAVDCAAPEHRSPWLAGLVAARAAQGHFEEALDGFDQHRRLFGDAAFDVLQQRLTRAARGWTETGCTAHETVCSQANQQIWSAALLFFIMGAPDAAESALHEALSVFDGDALTHWLMAAVLSELGRREEALLELDRAGAWQPTPELAAAVETLREELEDDDDE